MDDIGFDWNVKKEFVERIKDLKALKAERGHLRVPRNVNKSLLQFCICVRYTRRYPEKAVLIKLTEQRIKDLDGIGFDWSVHKSFMESVEEL